MADAQDNPYGTILGVFREDVADRSSHPWSLGSVVTVAPLVIKAGTLTLSGSDLLVNYHLLAQTYNVNLMNAAGSMELDGEDKQAQAVSLSGPAAIGSPLSPGDRVVLLPSQDRQQFIVLCKVVSA